MKKIITGIFVLMLLGISLGYAQDSSISDYTDQLFGGTSLFGYDETNQVNVEKINEDTITIKSPMIKNEADQFITEYDVLYSMHTIDEIMNDTTLIDTLHEKKLTQDTNMTGFLFVLDATIDGIEKDKIQYLYVVPKDVADIPGNASNEICFHLATKVFGEGKECILKVEEALTPVHNAAGADMELANVTHTVDGDTITLTWTAVDGSNNLEFFLLNEEKTDDDETRWEKLGEADMFDQKFVAPYDGEHSTTILIRPDNGGREKVYTLNFTPPVEEREPEIKPEPKVEPKISAVPKTGAKENMLVIFIIAVLGFVLYKAMRKSN